MGTNECSQQASKSSWDSQDFGDVNMVLKMLHFHKSSRPQWVKTNFQLQCIVWHSHQNANSLSDVYLIFSLILGSNEIVICLFDIFLDLGDKWDFLSY